MRRVDLESRLEKGDPDHRAHVAMVGQSDPDLGATDRDSSPAEADLGGAARLGKAAPSCLSLPAKPLIEATDADLTSAASCPPPRSDEGVGHSLSARPVRHRDRDWSANRHRPTESGSPPNCDLKTFRYAEVEPALRILVEGARAVRIPRPHNPEVTGSNPVPATTKALVRVPFGVTAKGT